VLERINAGTSEEPAMKQERRTSVRTTSRAILALLAAALVPAPAWAVTNDPPLVVLLCNFIDHPEQPNPNPSQEPSSLQYYRDMFTETGADRLGLYNYWKDVSYGNLNLTGTRVLGWYMVKDENGQFMTSAQFTGLTTGHQVDRCVQTAQADPANARVDFSRPVMVSALTQRDPLVQTTLAADVRDSDTTITVASSTGFPPPPFPVYLVDPASSFFPYGDEVNVTAVNGTTWTVVRNYERPGATAHSAGEAVVLLSEPAFQGATDAFAAFPANVSLAGAAREMGHLFGLNHSRRLSTSTSDYDDCYDIMSASCSGYSSSPFYANAYSFADTDFGDPNGGTGNGAGPGMSTPYLDQAGWLPRDRGTNFDSGGCAQTSFGMAALNRPEAPGYLEVRRPAAVTIPNPGGTTIGDYYTIELRNKSGWDRGIPADAFVLHLHGQDTYSYWVDSVAGSIVGHNGGLEAGDEYVDAANSTYIAVNSIDPATGSGVVTVGGCRIDPSLDYVGPTSGRFGEEVLLTAELKVNGSAAPVPSVPITLSVGRQSCQATTASDGHALCAVRLDQHPGAYTVQASFAGTPAYEPASASEPFTIERMPTSLTYTGDTSGDFNDAVTLAARLTDHGGSPLSGKTIAFTAGTQGCSDVTDDSGLASCTIVPSQEAGSYTLTVSFAGDVDYLPSSDSGTFVVTRQETTTTYTGPLVILQGEPVTLAGRLLEEGTVPITGRLLTLALGSQSCTGTTDAGGAASCTIASVTSALGPQPLSATFAGDAFYLPSADTSRLAIVFAFPSRGAFVLGDVTVASATPTTTVTWWGEEWSSLNALSGGPVSPSFKGFADMPSSNPPACSDTWTTSPGNRPPPASEIPDYMGVLVASSVSKSRQAFSGNTLRIVVVRTDPGYAPNPESAGTGMIVASFCN
jgi:hypothetical protein